MSSPTWTRRSVQVPRFSSSTAVRSSTRSAMDSRNDGALGCARSRRGHGIAGRNRACLQGHLPDAQSTHRHLHGVAVALARPTEPAKEARRDWPHGGRGREGGRADVKTTLSQRLGAETLGTAFLVAAVVGSGIMAAKLAGGNAA